MYGAVRKSCPVLYLPRSFEVLVRYIVKMSKQRLQETQAQVNEVVNMTKVNFDKLVERDDKLSDLDSRAEELQAEASQFERHAANLKRKMWWKNWKMWIILIVVIVVIIAAIVIWVVAKQQKSSSDLSGSSSDSSVAPATKANNTAPLG